MLAEAEVELFHETVSHVSFHSLQVAARVGLDVCGHVDAHLVAARVLGLLSR